MARNPASIAPPDNTVETVISDIDGTVIMVIRYHDFTIDIPGKGITQHKINTYIQTVDGRQWNPIQMLAKPPNHVPVGVCTHCRKPPFRWLGREKPTHGIVTLHGARVCADCGKLCCPRHIKRSRGGTYRCRPCAKKHRIKAELKAMFFTNVERD